MRESFMEFLLKCVVKDGSGFPLYVLLVMSSFYYKELNQDSWFLLCTFLSTVHLQHAGQVPGQQPTRSQQPSGTLDNSGLIRSAALTSLRSVSHPTTHPVSQSLSLIDAFLHPLTWLKMENQMCFCWLVESNLKESCRSHLISQDTILGWCSLLQESSFCWEFIYNSDVVEPGLTFTLQLHCFYFLFFVNFLSTWMLHDMYSVTSNKALQCWGLWKCS